MFDMFGQLQLRARSQNGGLSEHKLLHRKLLFETMLYKIKPKSPEIYRLSRRDDSIVLELSFGF